MIKIKNIHRHIIILAGCLIGFLAVWCQDATVTATLKQSQLLLGDQTQLVVQIKTTVDKPVIQWFNLPDTFNHLEILHRSPIDSTLEGTTKIYNQTFTITGFDSGIWVIPALVVNIANKKISSHPLDLKIVPVRLIDTAYHDIRDIITIPQQQTPWWYWLLAVLSVIVIAVIVWLWLKNRKKKPEVTKLSKSSLPLLEETLGQLHNLKNQGLPAKGEWKKYYTELTDIFKSFNEKRFHDGTMHKITDELLIKLNDQLTKDSVSEIAETLRIADAVKFAKYQPDISRSDIDVDIIEKIVKKLDSLK